MKLAEIAGMPRKDILEILEEKCINAAFDNCLYQASMKARHKGQVKERKSQVEKLVWKIASHVQGVAEAVKHKFSSKWEGLSIVGEAHQTRLYWLKDQVGTKAYSPISVTHLNKYYA